MKSLPNQKKEQSKNRKKNPMSVILGDSCMDDKSIRLESIKLAMNLPDGKKDIKSIITQAEKIEDFIQGLYTQLD